MRLLTTSVIWEECEHRGAHYCNNCSIRVSENTNKTRQTIHERRNTNDLEMTFSFGSLTSATSTPAATDAYSHYSSSKINDAVNNNNENNNTNDNIKKN